MLYIYTELAPKLTATASVAQGRGFNSQPEAATGISWFLNCISF